MASGAGSTPRSRSLHRPRLVLLDEPTTGADVRTRNEILQLVRTLADDGSAVVYSTHYLHEIEELDATVAFIDQGRIVARGGLSELVQRYGVRALELTFAGHVPVAARVDGAVVDGLDGADPDRRSRARRGHIASPPGCGRGRVARHRSRAAEPRVRLPHRHRTPVRRPCRGAGRMSAAPTFSAQRLGVILGHEFRVVRQDPLPILVLVVFPVITMAFLKPAFQPALAQHGYVHANGAEQVVPGQAAMTAFFLVSLITFAFFAEHAWATWDRLRVSPATSLEIVAGKALPRVAMGLAQFLVILVAGVVLFDLHVRGDVIALVPLVVVFSICLVLLGVAATALCRTAQQANAFAYLGMVLFGAIGGALVPIDVLPGWARAIAPITPTYWAMRGLRSVILDGRGLGGVVMPAAVLAAMALLFTVVALRRLRFDDAKVGFV